MKVQQKRRGPGGQCTAPPLRPTLASRSQTPTVPHGICPVAHMWTVAPPQRARSAGHSPKTETTSFLKRPERCQRSSPSSSLVWAPCSESQTCPATHLPPQVRSGRPWIQTPPSYLLGLGETPRFRPVPSPSLAPVDSTH